MDLTVLGIRLPCVGRRRYTSATVSYSQKSPAANRRWSTILVGLAVLTSSPPGPTEAQPAAAASQSSSYLAFLLNLPGDTVSIRYTPGSLDRAVNVQDRVQVLADDFAGWSRQPTLLLLYVLSREEWQESKFEDPFGVPQRMSTTEVAMTAWGDGGTVELWHGLLGRRLPVLPGTPMRGSPQEVASLALHDLVAQIEVSRMLLEAGGFSGDQPWVDGLLPHVVALSSYLKHEGERLPEIRRAFESLSLRAGGPGAMSLARASQSRILAERLWLEAQYFQAALRLTESEGKAPAKPILKRARKNGGRVEAADLLARDPALGDWLAAAFASEGTGESG